VTVTRWGLGLLAVAAIVVAAWRLASGGGAVGAEYPIPGARVPYTVEVLNGTDVDALARTVTLRLRRLGLDVVQYGAAGTSTAESTIIYVRSTDPAAAAAVQEALGIGRIVAQPDASLLVDVTVVLGRDAPAALERHP
jgi:hypothetical protein